MYGDTVEKFYIYKATKKLKHSNKQMVVLNLDCDAIT
jgi:hypothetical protein